jgi:hypothetical protein
MIRHFFQILFAGATALFWADKSKILMGIIFSFSAVQHIACTYGPPNDIDNGNDPSPDCSPQFSVEKISRIDYSECENTLADLLENVSACEAPCKNGEMLNATWRPDGSIDSGQFVCYDERPEDCSYNTMLSKKDSIIALGDTCILDHMKADSSLFQYLCGTEVVSVEEADRR